MAGGPRPHTVCGCCFVKCESIIKRLPLIFCLRAQRAEAIPGRSVQELEKRYEMALELLGERNEHADKLEEDIREMKHIFRSQLSLMADQLSTAKQAASAG